jgi:hypothetical protein
MVELLAQFFVPQWTPDAAHRNFWRYNKLLGWAHRPNEQGVFTHQDFSVTVTINSQGLRDKEYPLGRVAGKKRVLVLSDSYGWGFGVEDDEIFTELLEEKYPDWEIINASVSGYGTDQQYLYLKYWGLRYQPDVVLLLFGPNDVKNNKSIEQYMHNKPRFELINDKPVLTNYPVPRPYVRQRFAKYIVTETYFLAKVYHLSNMIENQLRAKKASANNHDLPSDKALTQVLLRSLNQLVEQNGAQLVVVSIPMQGKGLKNLLSTTFQAEGVPYLALDEALSNSPERLTFEHDEHWNARGHQVAAAAIEEFLINGGIFP